jgi:DNA primase
MAYIAESTIQELNDKLDAVAVVGDYVRLEKRGGRYWGLCPFHNEKTPSFTVDPDRKMYYCFGCSQGGGIINFVMEMDKLSFPEAVETLAKRLGIEVAYEHTGTGGKDGGKNLRLEELAELYRRVAVSFHHLLMQKEEGKGALDYVLSRGIEREVLERFRLGYAPRDRSWLFRFLSAKGYSEAFLDSSGLFSKNYPRMAFFANRLIFPIADRQGRTVAFGGRFLEEERASPGTGSQGPKYLNSAESELYKKRETLFAVDLALPEIRRTREVYLAEGYMDVIALHQAGIPNAVAPLGTAFTGEQARLLRRWAERLYLIFDADDAGQNAAIKAILTGRENGLVCAVVDLRENKNGGDPELKKMKDPADILKQFGGEILQNRVKNSILDFEYFIKRSKSLFDPSRVEGKAGAVAFLFPYMETLDSEVSREACIRDIAGAFGADPQAVRDDYHRYRGRNPGKESRGDVSGAAGTGPVRMNDELFLLTAAAANAGLYPKLRSALSIEELEDPNAKELFIALEEWFRNGGLGIDDLLSRISGDPLRQFVVQRGATEAFAVHPEQLISDGIRRIKQKRLERRRAEIVSELRIAGNGGREEGAGLENLLAEKMFIDTELRRFKEVNE